MSDIAMETLFFFLALIGAGALFTIVWAVLHWTGILGRADDEYESGVDYWMRRR